MFPATRIEALNRLKSFLPKAGRDYAAKRNFDLPAADHPHVSKLSPYLRHRLLTEDEVVQAVLARWSLSSAEKFIQEICWRTYWKGWLEMRPQVWRQYQRGLQAALNRVQIESGLRDQWEAACQGTTGIDGFDGWAHELVETGYLHNHARMWFASIWIFTLRLPWELGADFFLRHLLDGDPASNTLGWRWVGGIQTPGKTYLARVSNISKYTEGRVRPLYQLATEAPALTYPPAPDRQAIPESGHWDPTKRTGLLLHEDDLAPGFLLADGATPIAATALLSPARRSPLAVSDAVHASTVEAAKDALDRLDSRIATSPAVQEPYAIHTWAKAHGLTQIVAPYAPVGPAADALRTLSKSLEIPVIQVQRPSDQRAWPHATHGFFKFKDKIPSLVADLKGLTSVA